ncbi:MAG: hypothetical protein KF712_10280 [Akkermansiaceae bacterium]|nr:hypothetical protein [Akkermansiaceae bacterium]
MDLVAWQAMNSRIVPAILMFAGPALGSTLIDTRSAGSASLTPFGYHGETPGNSVDDDQDGVTDEEDPVSIHHIVGQTFRLPPGFPILSQVTVRTVDTKFSGAVPEHDIDAPFKVVLMAWDEAELRPTGNVLFQSGVITPPQDGQFHDHVIPTGNISLQANAPHVIFLILQDPAPSRGNHTLLAVASRDGNPYAGGQLVTKTNGTTGIGGVAAEAWLASPSRDLSLILEASPVPDGLTADPGGGTPIQIPFGTHGDIPGNSIDDDQDGVVDEGFEAPLHRHTVGQSFLAPPTAQALGSVSFVFRDARFNGINPTADKPADFILTIAEWDPLLRRPTGGALFESTTKTIPETGGNETITFPGLDLPVTPGKHYIAYASIENLGLTSGNHTHCAVVARNDNPYPSGTAYTASDDTRDPASLTDAPWQESSADLAGEITFRLIDPGQDSNNDGVPDAWVAGYGLDPSVDYSALAGAIRSNHLSQIQASPIDFGLYDENSIQDLRFGGVLLRKTGTGVDIDFDIETSDTLTGWEPFETIQRSIPMTGNKGFLRVKASGGSTD